MTKANQMLFTEGFELTHITDITEKYTNRNLEQVYFNKKSKTYTVKGRRSSPLVVSADLHKAINRKVLELGW